MLGVQLLLIRELLGGDGCGRHGNGPANQHAARQTDAREPCQDAAGQGRESDLQAAQAENHCPGRQHARQGEVQPDNKHEEHDAQLAKEADALRGRQELQTVRADQNTGEQITGDGREGGGRAPSPRRTMPLRSRATRTTAARPWHVSSGSREK